MKKRRLSLIDLLPEEARPFVRRALDDLRARDQPKEVIRQTLNRELAVLGLKPISRAGFNRYSLRYQLALERHARAVEVARAFADKAKELESGNVGATTAAYLRDILFEVVSAQMEEGEEVPLKAIGQAAQALFRLNQAEQIAEQQRRAIEHEAAAKAADQAVTAARASGLPEEAVNKLKAAMGIKA